MMDQAIAKQNLISAISNKDSMAIKAIKVSYINHFGYEAWVSLYRQATLTVNATDYIFNDWS